MVTGPLLADDIALVTGAARRIGLAIAETLAREGARVLLTDILEQEGQAAATRLADAGLSTRFMPGDLRDPELPAQLVECAQEAFGPVSLFVHCASPRQRNHDLLAIPESEWDHMLDVNLRAGYRLASLLGQQMRERRLNGKMLFISSLHADTPRGAIHYSAAKSGMTMMVKELAKALGPDGIRVNAIAPGTITNDPFPGAEETAKSIALRRIGTYEEIANTAVALLSDRFSSYVTGATVVVDGGLSLFNWYG